MEFRIEWQHFFDYSSFWNTISKSNKLKILKNLKLIQKNPERHEIIRKNRDYFNWPIPASSGTKKGFNKMNRILQIYCYLSKEFDRLTPLPTISFEILSSQNRDIASSFWALSYFTRIKLNHFILLVTPPSHYFSFFPPNIFLPSL